MKNIGTKIFKLFFVLNKSALISPDHYGVKITQKQSLRIFIFVGLFLKTIWCILRENLLYILFTLFSNLQLPYFLLLLKTILRNFQYSFHLSEHIWRKEINSRNKHRSQCLYIRMILFFKTVIYIREKNLIVFAIRLEDSVYFKRQ